MFAVDLRGFGDSDVAVGEHDSDVFADDLHALIGHLGLGPVHVVGQDISGPTVFRLAVKHPEDLLSLSAVESGLPGFGLEMLADVTKGGAWYIGVLATPGVADVFFKGRERELIGDFLFPAATAISGAVTPADIAEFARGYARDKGWSGAQALYGSMLREGGAIAALARSHPLTLPTLAVGAGGGDFTRRSIAEVHAGDLSASMIEGVGHYVALEAPETLAETILTFIAEIDATQGRD